MPKLYESEAEVVIDGTATPTYVRFMVFTEGGLKSWEGVLDSEGSNLAMTAIEADEVLLRMADGKEGRIIVTNDPTEQGVAFTGSGPAPI
ncbi:hypothetical protein [Streptomyces sp. NPDC007346]|uniref:hypothetical protein n=1 Tax=Streptomyces sp. NPDC007346 TaxID=3154682 RepID=UPI003455DF51